MGIRFIYPVVIAIIVSTACNCSGRTDSPVAKKPPGVYYGSGTNTLANLPADAVLVNINGYAFTRRDFDLEQAVFGKMMAFLKNGRMDVDADDIRRLQAMRAPRVLNTVLRRELLNQEARKKGIVATDAARRRRREDLAAAITARSPSANFDVEELAKRMGVECGKVFLENLEKEAQNLELSWKVAGARLDVKDDEIATVSNKITLANKLTDATNAVLRAHLEKALERVKKGEDFTNVGMEMSMHGREESFEWGMFSVDDFETTDYPDVAGFLAQNPPPGTIGGPFQCDDGVSIVKVLSVAQTKQSVADEPSSGKSGQKQFKLARISVDAFEKRKMPSNDTLRKQLEDLKRKKFEAEFGERLFAAAVIEFPSGTNLFANCAKESPLDTRVRQIKRDDNKEQKKAQHDE